MSILGKYTLEKQFFQKLQKLSLMPFGAEVI